MIDSFYKTSSHARRIHASHEPGSAKVHKSRFAAIRTYVIEVEVHQAEETSDTLVCGLCYVMVEELVVSCHIQQVFMLSQHNFQQRQLAAGRAIDLFQTQLRLHCVEEIVESAHSSLTAIQVHEHEQIAITAFDVSLSDVEIGREGATNRSLRSTPSGNSPGAGTTTSLRMIRSCGRRLFAKGSKIL